MYRTLALVVLLSLFASSGALGGPELGGGISAGSIGGGDWSLASFELYANWRDDTTVTSRLGFCYLPPLFPQEPPAIYLGLGARLSFGKAIRGIVFGTGGPLIEKAKFQGSIISPAINAGIALEIEVDEHLGFYISSSFVAASKGNAEQGSSFKLYFPWSIGITWKP